MPLLQASVIVMIIIEQWNWPWFQRRKASLEKEEFYNLLLFPIMFSSHMRSHHLIIVCGGAVNRRISPPSPGQGICHHIQSLAQCLEHTRSSAKDKWRNPLNFLKSMPLKGEKNTIKGQGCGGPGTVFSSGELNSVQGGILQPRS